ncbi:hypothetical protein AB5J72_51525 (plasmid) [Streptomyces sp. CG1]|uniref:hypothetical protein n=1 Tax=Streptomyces sp. CG1 TaxID=1287523 RepID=UPI0034E2541A
MATTTHQAAPTTSADYDGYQKVVDIVNSGFKDALAQILRKLGDPNTFGTQVRELADRHGVPLKAMDATDTSALYDAFWRTTTGVQADINWQNADGVPGRNRGYVEQINPTHNPSTGVVSFWGFSLPFGISFST